MTASPHESGAIGGDYGLGLVCPHALEALLACRASATGRASESARAHTLRQRGSPPPGLSREGRQLMRCRRHQTETGGVWQHALERIALPRGVRVERGAEAGGHR